MAGEDIGQGEAVDLYGLIDEYRTQLDQQRLTMATVGPLIGEQTRRVGAANARIAELRGEQHQAQEQVKAVLGRARRLGQEALEGDLDSGARILAGFMSTYLTPEEALNGTVNLALLDSMLMAGERVPVISADSLRSSPQVSVGVLSGFETSIKQSAYGAVRFTFDRAVTIKPPRRDRLAEITEDDGKQIELSASHFRSNVYSPNNIPFTDERSASIGEQSVGSMQEGTIIGEEAVLGFFKKYSEILHLTARELSLEHNPVFNIWRSLHLVGVDVELPEELKTVWLDSAEELIIESVANTLAGNDRKTIAQTPFLIESYLELGGTEEDIIEMLLAARDKTKQADTVS
jgi:hypothetical protein